MATTQITPACSKATTLPDTPTHLIQVPDHFGDAMLDPETMNKLRRDLRSWFMAYVPVWEESYSPNNLEASTASYEMLDEFLSGLVSEGIKQLEGRNNV